MRKLVLCLCAGLLFYSCQKPDFSAQGIEEKAEMSIDFHETSLPPNLGSVPFLLLNAAEKWALQIEDGANTYSYKGRKNGVTVPAKTWKKLLSENKGGKITIKAFVFRDKQWYSLLPFSIFIAEEDIDPYVAYRLIEPLYDVWGEMGLYQYDLTRLRETMIISNRLFGTENCVNCHSFADYDSEKMMFHSRNKRPGTLVYSQQKFTKYKTRQGQEKGNCTYPAWHPEGRHIAFSVNNVAQIFGSDFHYPTQVFDLSSHLAVLDLQNEQLIGSPLLRDESKILTFPYFDARGEYLYYCESPIIDSLKDNEHMHEFIQTVRHNLLRIRFDAAKGCFGDSVEVVFDARSLGKSVSHPRPSPCGRYLLFTLSNWGTFPIWYKEADLYLLDMETGECRAADGLNSAWADSYHSWSSNGRWVVVGSRRGDGVHTRLYISYFDKNGHFHKAFLMPQRKARFYETFMKSYNIPEFTKNAVPVKPWRIARALKEDPRPVKGPPDAGAPHAEKQLQKDSTYQEYHELFQ